MDESQSGRISIQLATAADRIQIYRARHRVYAIELQQHSANESESLSDALDDFNIYLVAKRDKTIVGFISITPSNSPRFSIDKYVDRNQIPVLHDGPFVELRLLTVTESIRGGFTASLLLYAATRWLQVHNTRRVIAIGRHEVMQLYSKIGFAPLGISIQSGKVSFELMSIDREQIDLVLKGHARIADRIRRSVSWELDFPIAPESECYHGGASIATMECDSTRIPNQMNIVNADVLDAWFPPCRGAVESIQNFAPWLARTSPPAQSNSLEKEIARARGIDATSVVAGAGSSDLIYRAFQAWLSPNSRVLLVTPCYGEYEFVCKHVIGCRVDQLRLNLDSLFQLESDQFIRYLGRAYDLIVVVNPNNPTGVHLDRRFWDQCLDHIPSGTRLWVDECYIDYVDSRESLEPLASSNANLVVCKSLSKNLALSGLRIGYLVLHPKLGTELRRRTPPWNLGTLSQIAAAAALQDPNYYEARYRETHRLREDFEAAVRDLGFSVFPGTANFFLAYLPSDGPSKESLLEFCRTQGVFLRDTFPTSPCLGDRSIRIAVKDAATNRKIIEVLRNSLKQIQRLER